MKIAGGVVTVLVAVFAGIGVVFFGWDVHKTRGAMYEARDDLHKRMEDIRKDHQALRELKERLEKLGAELIDAAEKKSPPASPEPPPPPVPGPPAPTPAPEAPKAPPAPPPTTGRAPAVSISNRDREFLNLDEPYEVEAMRARMRQHIEAAEFEWTTLSTLARKVGLPENVVHDLAKGDDLIQLGTGRQGAVLLRLRKFNGLAPLTVDHEKVSALLKALRRSKDSLIKGPDES